MNLFFDIKKILGSVKNYKYFLTLDELNARAFEISKKYGFKTEKIGESEEGRVVYIISCGNGKKNVLVYGFPHPNEPIGSLTIDFLIDYFGKNPLELEKTGFRWNFIYTIDPDGTKLNERWFKDISLKNYFYNFYYPSEERMIDWTFPIKYKEYEWNYPLKETKILMKIINQLMPDLMCPLHNSSLGGAYFYLTKKFDKKYYRKIIHRTHKLKIPLDLGEPEEPFLKKIIKPFYYDISLRDYYEYKLKLGLDPKKTIPGGDSSTGYLLNLNPHAVVITGEIPYFYNKEISNDRMSKKTRREIWLKKIQEEKENNKFMEEFISEILLKLKEPNDFYYVIKEYKEDADDERIELINHVKNSKEFERKASFSEVFDCEIGNKFFICRKLGQLHRAAILSKLGNFKIKEIENKLDYHLKILNKSKIKIFPIKKLVQLQVLLLFETLNELKKGF